MKASSHAHLPAAYLAASLRIRTAQTPADWEIAHRMLDEEHLLGAGREAGDRLCQFILEEEPCSSGAPPPDISRTATR